MIGAIIGDLAVSTWKDNKKLFYRELIEEDADLSQYGMVAYELALLLASDENPTVKSLEKSFDKHEFWEGLYTRNLVKEGLRSQLYPEQANYALITMALSGWKTDDISRASEVAREYSS
ncbi:MAG: hypothetical protein NC453_30440, partial [Muribaculum sp.]|nr:hypothetical protein [Muribaculum sp.]